MKELSFKFLNYTSLRKAYMLIFSFAVFMRVLMPFAYHESQKFTSIMFGLVALFGVGIIFFDIFTEKIMFKQKNTLFLCLFLVVCFISSLLNMKYGIVGNIRNMAWLAISFFLLYPVDFKRTKADIVSEITLVSNILIIVWFFAIFVSFFMFLFQIGYYLDIYPDSFARQGFIEERLFGIFEDPNFAAIISMVLFILSYFNFKICRKKIIKVFYIICMVLDYIYIVLSGSRTAKLLSGVVTFIVVYLIFRNKELILKNVKSKFLKETTFLLTGVVLSFAVILSINASEKILSYAPNLVTQISGSMSDGEKSSIKSINIQREDVNNTADISNCRLRIWTAAMELFKSKPIFGTSPRNMRAYAKAEFPKNFIALRSYAVHNVYIDILTSTGIVGALFIAIFFMKYLISVCEYIFRKGHKKNYNLVVMGIAIVATVAGSAAFLSEIMFVSTIGVLAFWCFMGYTIYFIENDNIDGGSCIVKHED